jgi:hypothetical protein
VKRSDGPHSLSSRCLLRSVRFGFVSYRRDASWPVDAFLGPQRDDVLEFFHHVCVGFALGHQTRAALALVVHLGDSLLASERRALLRHRNSFEDSLAFF